MANAIYIIFVAFMLMPLMAKAQNNNYVDNYEITDEELESFSFEGGGKGTASNGVQDFPASDQNEFNYGGVDDFADEELNFEDNGANTLNFGNENEQGDKEEVIEKVKPGNVADAPPKKKSSKDEDPGSSSVDPDQGGSPSPTASDSLDGTGMANPIDTTELPDLGNAAVDQPPATYEAVTDSPYAPLPEDTMAPPAPQLPEPNEFAGAPAVPGTRRIMAVGEAPEFYRVRAGDTLFDICDQLLDEPNYWPKLWALNPEIRNPHFIYPGIKLRFYPGDDDYPPYLEVVKEEDVVPIDQDGLGNQDLITADLADMLFEKFIPRVSDVQYVEEADIASFDLDNAGNQTRGDTVGVVVPAFYFDSEVDPIAVAVANREGWELSGDKQHFLMEVEESVSPGTIYTIVRPSQVPEIHEFDEDVGYRYEFVAAAKVTRTLEDDFAEAVVVYTRLGVKQGDMLISYKSFKRSLTVLTGGITGAENGTVIGFEYSHQTMGAQGDMVFLSGAHSPNAVIPVYNNTQYLHLNSHKDDFPETVRPVATIKVIESSPQASLGYILNSTRAVRIGDYTGKG